MGIKIIISVLIIILIVIVFRVGVIQTKWHSVTGFYEASDEFCIKSGLSTMYMYFTDNGEGFIYMLAQDGTIVMNTPFTLNISTKYCKSMGESVTKKYSSTCDIYPLPQNGYILYNAKAGGLVWYHEDTVYAELYKNTKASNGVV